MPQTKAVAPFKAPIDEDKIKIDWLPYTDEWGNKFPDGETYSLIYPEVTILKMHTTYLWRLLIIKLSPLSTTLM